MSLALLDRLVELAAGDSEVCRWLLQGRDAWRSGVPLADALGLTGAAAKRARNAHLADAARLLRMDRGDDVSTWELAGLLAAEINRHQTTIAPRLRAGSTALLSPVQQCIRQAASTGAGLVTCQRRLYDLLR